MQEDLLLVVSVYTYMIIHALNVITEQSIGMQILRMMVRALNLIADIT